MIIMILQMKEKKGWIKKMIEKIYLLKVKDLLNQRKKMKKKVKSQPEETIAERIKLRR